MKESKSTIQLQLQGHLTTKAASEFLGVHPDTLRRWEKKGIIQAKRHPANQYRLFNEDDLLIFMEKMQ